MIDNIEELVKVFNKDIKITDKKIKKIKVNIIRVLNEEIIENNKLYFMENNESQKEEIKNNLIRLYDLLFYYQSKEKGIDNAYVVEDDVQKLNSIYVLSSRPERFEIDYDLLNNINVINGLSEEEAYELLKWTSNNTRDNMNKSICDDLNYVDDNVYNDYSLTGFCGFSQFSSLYPLQKMGLKITINNVGNGELSNNRHAFGTVFIPINSNGTIIEKQYIIDCTYRQFFTLESNCISKYLSSTPNAGFFVSKNEKDFSLELLKNGFVEATEDNLKKYLKPFFSQKYNIKDIEKIDNDFGKIDVTNYIETCQDDFDYTEDEFLNWGMNLSVSNQKQK